MLPIGLMFDQYGANMLGWVGAVLTAAGLAVLGARVGLDATTAPLLAPGILLCDFGSMMNSNSLAGLLWHFPGSMLFVISLMTTSYAIASLLPLAFRFAMEEFDVPLEV